MNCLYHNYHLNQQNLPSKVLTFLQSAFLIHTAVYWWDLYTKYQFYQLYKFIGLAIFIFLSS